MLRLLAPLVVLAFAAPAHALPSTDGLPSFPVGPGPGCYTILDYLGVPPNALTEGRDAGIVLCATEENYPFAGGSVNDGAFLCANAGFLQPGCSRP